MDRFESDTLKFIRENGLIDEGDYVTVGFSGGADSVCLLNVLNDLRRLLKIELNAVHVNHNLRGEESQRDEAFCRDFAKRIGVSFNAVSVDVAGRARTSGESEEEAGRNLRYEALEREALGFMKEASEREGRTEPAAFSENGKIKVAVAHHADDQAETILLNLFRGSGLKGLGGMSEKRGALIRPLLWADKREILEYLGARGLGFVNDSTNFENDHTRNRLRNVIMPEIRDRVNLRYAQHITQAGAVIREADLFFEQSAGEYLREFNVEEHGKIRFIRLGQKELKNMPRILRRYVIIGALRKLQVPLKDWGGQHFAEIDNALYADKGYHADLPGGVFVRNKYKETLLYAGGKAGYGGEDQNFNL